MYGLSRLRRFPIWRACIFVLGWMFVPKYTRGIEVSGASLYFEAKSFDAKHPTNLALTAFGYT